MLNEQELADKHYEFVLNKFPGKGIRELSNGFMRNNFWLNFGKHSRTNPWDLAWNYPSYLIWAYENVHDKLPAGLREFIETFNEDIKERAKEIEDKKRNLFK